jgi:hypothetical protein
VNVLVDTSVWSLALRRARPVDSPVVRELAELIREGRVVMIGPVRQEILSGIRDARQSRHLRLRLRAFPDATSETSDFEDAAHLFNRSRAAGIQGSNTDFLICAMALARGLAVFTTDADFIAYQRVCALDLHEPRG